MAILCAHCGNILAKDDARFCNKCGTLVASHPFSPQSLAAQKQSSQPSVEVPEPSESSQPVMREQIAQQSLSRPTKPSAKDEPPAWMSQLEKGTSSPAKPRPSPSSANAAIRELRVRVWEEKETVSVVVPPEAPSSPKEALALEDQVKEAPQDPAVEELPTLQLPVTPLAPSTLEQAMSEEETIEKRPTVLMEATVPPSESVSKSAPIASQASIAPPCDLAPLERGDQHQIKPLEAPLASSSVQADHLDAVAHIAHIDTVHLAVPAPLPVERGISGPSVFSHGQGAVPVEMISEPSRVITPSRSQSRVPIMIVSVLLLVLILGGVGAWLYLYQPFSIPAITQTQQAFQDSSLGVSLLYPSGWTAKVDHGKSTISIADSSHTAQVTISMTNTAGDLNQYLRQQATQLGMTGIGPGTPLVFAGASWQQIQGTVQQQGANYSCAMLATIHGNHVVLLVQLAHQTVYADEEKNAFAPIRASLRLL